MAQACTGHRRSPAAVGEVEGHRRRRGRGTQAEVEDVDDDAFRFTVRLVVALERERVRDLVKAGWGAAEELAVAGGREGACKAD